MSFLNFWNWHPRSHYTLATRLSTKMGMVTYPILAFGSYLCPAPHPTIQLKSNLRFGFNYFSQNRRRFVSSKSLAIVRT